MKLKLKSSLKSFPRKAAVYITVGTLTLNMNRIPAIRKEKFVFSPIIKAERITPNPNLA